MCTPPRTTTLVRFTRDRCGSSRGLPMPLSRSGRRQRMRWSRLRAAVTENARLESTRKGHTRIILNHGSRAIRRETHMREGISHFAWEIFISIACGHRVYTDRQLHRPKHTPNHGRGTGANTKIRCVEAVSASRSRIRCGRRAPCFTGKPCCRFHL